MSHGPGAGRKRSAQAGPFYDVINEGEKKKTGIETFQKKPRLEFKSGDASLNL